MANKKKKRKKRAPTGPAPAQPADREARKEAAQREREKTIRAYRRGRLMKRVGIAALTLAVLGGGGFLVFNAVQASAQRDERMAALATEIGCGSVLTDDAGDLVDEGAGHVGQPPAYENVPATSGPHFDQWLPPGESVYDVPFDPTFEFRAVHNLEHGYVIMYYEQEGDGALDQGVLEELTGLAESQRKVLLAPYPNLQEDENLVLVAWNRAQRCEVSGDSAGDTVEVARYFIDQFREGSEAPEPNAA